GLHKPIAALNALVKTGYCVVDGICGDLSFEEGGTPVEAGRIIVGQNPVTVDSYCAGLIGYRPDDIEHLVYAKQYGVGQFATAQTEIVELNTDNKPPSTALAGRKAEQYKKLIQADAACSACYSALVFALQRLGGRVDGPIYIGQGYKGKSGEGIGIGNCASGFSRCVKGCPPKAVEIVQVLQS
ncbi:MAG: DUF362 domain-containing protein, partial [Lachnospiraceae bacterium]|nr:DUF362 domain-containing protein [Lachnospiraceae bacterium]